MVRQCPKYLVHTLKNDLYRYRSYEINYLASRKQCVSRKYWENADHYQRFEARTILRLLKYVHVNEGTLARRNLCYQIVGTWYTVGIRLVLSQLLLMNELYLYQIYAIKYSKYRMPGEYLTYLVLECVIMHKFIAYIAITVSGKR